MTAPTNKLIGDTANITFNGLASPWIVVGFNVREEIAEIQPEDAGSTFSLTPAQYASALSGRIRKRRTTEVFRFYNKFLKSTVNPAELRALANPNLGPLTITVEGLTFTGYLDDLDMQYNFQGDFVEITIALMYQWPWSLIYAI